MPAFSDPDELQTRLDGRILQNGAISLYDAPDVLAEDLDSLGQLGYLIYEFNCDAWDTPDALHEEFARVLALPTWYGRNFAALRDCLGDKPSLVHGGLAFVLRGFDAFVATHRDASQELLDVLEDNSRWRLLFGRRLLALVQIDDAALEFGQVGGRPVSWNRREWLRALRGLRPRPTALPEPQ